ncbi:MAG: endolytic transglycosylase MltG [Clostridia bacterium]|nr:endolytic transglycosylase MltG [Clostridia bacterium]MBQ2315799.1 endolytic transglycosylase MltG [Clostridia bacterium]
MQENNNLPNNNDEFVIGQGFEVSEYTQSTAKSKKRKSKKSGAKVVKGVIWVLAIIIVSVGMAVAVIYAGADYLGLGFGRGGNTEMDIPMGSPTSVIAEKLNESGAVKLPLFFRVYSRLKGYDSSYKYGYYSFNTEIGYGEIADMLMTEGAKAENVTVTIPEGTGINDYIKNVNGEDVTVKGIATILEEAGVCTKSDFIYALNEVEFEDSRLLENCNVGKTYYALEGYLFPETYNFYSYDSAECAKMVVDRMIAQTDKRITDEMYDRAEELGYTMNEILTMASVIQMEAGQNFKEMKNVAAVFYNRLNDKNEGTLGSSPTCYYGESFKNDDGRYNTYNVKGLPPGPLCSPGLEAIKAALYPTKDSPYLYFVTDKDGNFYYHKTAAEQQKTINSLKQGNNWIYEYFN